MPTITHTISAAALAQVVAAYCGHFAYDANKINGETQSQFALRMQKQQVKETVARWKARAAADVAQLAAYNAALEEIDIT